MLISKKESCFNIQTQALWQSIFSSTYFFDNGKNKDIINIIIKSGVSLCLCLCVHENEKVCVCLCVYVHEHRHVHLCVGHSETSFNSEEISFLLPSVAWGLNSSHQYSCRYFYQPYHLIGLWRESLSLISFVSVMDPIE